MRHRACSHTSSPGRRRCILVTRFLNHIGQGGQGVISFCQILRRKLKRPQNHRNENLFQQVAPQACLPGAVGFLFILAHSHRPWSLLFFPSYPHKGLWGKPAWRELGGPGEALGPRLMNVHVSDTGKMERFEPSGMASLLWGGS